MKKKLNNPTTRIIASIVLGIVIGVIVCFIAIRFGYSHIKSTDLMEYNVNLIGLNIFNIQREGAEYIGTPNNSNMMFIGIIFSMILAIVTETIVAFKNRKRGESK
ncbi:LlsX family protein [Marinilactibacillus psychrotolerans]|uniref:LlsX family protein n=1 Tax=Marinilactibacillus psychrotolerans TaxID=191770 RepID=UPI001C7DABB4|nr:LlsX family protein [Marinilactibacillus psychrotolerans]GEQ33701.1 hypothetical protein B795N_15830 [Marinilactibacillus psychrotolerans]